MTRIHSFVYTISCAGFAAVVLFLPLGERWWGFATFVAEVLAGLGWGVREWRKAHPVPPRPRPDYARIAELEREIFGHEPGPAGAALVRMRRDFRMCDHERPEELAGWSGQRWLRCRDCGAVEDIALSI